MLARWLSLKSGEILYFSVGHLNIFTSFTMLPTGFVAMNLLPMAERFILLMCDFFVISHNLYARLQGVVMCNFDLCLWPYANAQPTRTLPHLPVAHPSFDCLTVPFPLMAARLSISQISLLRSFLAPASILLSAGPNNIDARKEEGRRTSSSHSSHSKSNARYRADHNIVFTFLLNSYHF